MSKSTKTTLLIAVLAILGAVAISARADELAELDAAVSTAEVELDQALTEIDELTRKLTRATIRLDQARRDLRQAEHERGLYTDGDSSRLRTVPPIVPPARVELAPLPGDLIMGPSRKEAETSRWPCLHPGTQSRTAEPGTGRSSHPGSHRRVPQSPADQGAADA